MGLGWDWDRPESGQGLLGLCLLCFPGAAGRRDQSFGDHPAFSSVESSPTRCAPRAVELEAVREGLSAELL